MPEKLRPDTFGTRISPSSQNPWFGNYGGRPGRFTGEQQRELEYRGLERATVETIVCTMPAAKAEFYWPRGEAAPVYEFECPVLERNFAGLVQVITPLGSTKWIHASGVIGRGPGRGR